MGKQLLTIKEFCSLYSVGRTRAYELIAEAKIQAVKIGASRRIVTASAEKWMASLPPVPPKSSAADDDK